MNITYIKATKSGGGGGSLSTAKLMKTGQTTSYRTGDDGDLQEGRDVDFFTLAENNPFGTTDRFTDELGTQVYANDIVIDWSTYDGAEVLGWYRIRGSYLDLSWNDAIDNSLLFSVGGFTSGWRVPNMQELMSIINYSTILPYNYAPINQSLSGVSFWSATTDPATTNNALVFRNAWNGHTNTRIKTNTSSSYRVMPCRTFTVTGTTLS